MERIATSGPSSILVVEDDLDTREAICEGLRDLGYEVLAASDGREALSQLRSGIRPSLILLDLMMPPLNGWQFRLQQLADADLAKIPVIVITAAEPYWGIPEGVTGYVRKPFDLRTLSVELERCGLARPRSASD